jgi:23S rRNA pseudouridine2605 synthase
MLNKPVGYVSTVSDPHAAKTVLELVTQVEERVYPVGRLDADSSGLLLLTNDGEFANRLTHPRYHVPKIYRVRVRGFVGRDTAIRLSDGIDLPEGRTAPAELRFIEYHEPTQSSVIDITLYEGRNRQVRRMMETVGHPVRELTRIAFGSLRLKGLLPGTWRKLRAEEVESLLNIAQATPTPGREQRRDKRPFRPRNAPQPVEADRDARVRPAALGPQRRNAPRPAAAEREARVRPAALGPQRRNAPRPAAAERQRPR